jgi:Tol biopolymer transport system component
MLAGHRHRSALARPGRGVLAAAIATASLAPAGCAAADPGGPVRLWSGAGVDVQGGVSPDGRLLSFVDWSSGDLAVRELERGTTRRVTAKGGWDVSGEFAGRSVFSPDGERLAFAWYNESQRYDLRVIALDGSARRVIHDDDAVAYIEVLDWSPDGREVLATLHAADRTTRLVAVPVDGGAVRTLAAAAAGAARFAPDGASIVYDAPPDEREARRAVFLLPSTGGEPLMLAAHPTDGYAPHWLPDGSGVVFASDRGGRVGVWRLDLVEGRPAGEPLPLHDDLGPIRPLGLSRTGALYHALMAETRRAYVVSIDPASGALLGPPRPVSAPNDDVYSAPAWSPDGRRLAFTTTRGGPGGGRVLAITDIGGHELDAIPARTGSTGRHAPPRWSPDGRRLLVDLLPVRQRPRQRAAGQPHRGSRRAHRPRARGVPRRRARLRALAGRRAHRILGSGSGGRRVGDQSHACIRRVLSATVHELTARS